MCSQGGAFPLPCCPWAVMEDLNEIRTAIISENIQLLQSYIVTNKKKLKEVVFAKEEFLHKRIRNKDVYVDMMSWLISQNMQLSSMVIWQHGSR